MILGVLLVVTLLLTWLSTEWVRRNALRLDLVHEPSNRSSHTKPTPHGGGLGIVLTSSVIGIWLVLFLTPIQSTERVGLLVLTVIGLALSLAVVGLIDDIRHLPARVRFGMQAAVCSGLLVLLGEMPVIPLVSTYLPLGEGPKIGGWMLFGLLLLAGVWWINLFNFMDGIDGIASVQAIYMMLAGAGLAGWVHPEVVSDTAWIWMICVAAATLGFLVLNWPPAKIFMGDVGSTWLAFVIFALALVSVQADWLDYVVWLVLSAVFVTDATVTLFTRIVRGERWYEAHRSHTYQRLSRRWAGHRPVIMVVIAINLLWLLPLAWACLAWPAWTWSWVILAYLPLVMAAVMLGAGKQDHE